MQYTIEQIKNFTEEEWQEYRRKLWKEKQAYYSDKENIPVEFWPIKKAKNAEYRRRAWIKQCNRYSGRLEDATWFLETREEYIIFVTKQANKNQKIAEAEQRKQAK